MKYQLDTMNGYYVIKTGEKSYIIDTGLPESMGDDKLISMLGRTYEAEQWSIYSMPRMIDNHVGEKIDGLIGNDILVGHIVTLDFTGKIITFDELAAISSDSASDSSENIAFQLPLSVDKRVPIIDIVINHQRVKTIFDTGAPIPYANTQILNNLASAGLICDFSPIYGNICTPSHIAEFKLGSLVGSVQIGESIPELSDAFYRVGVEAIVGPSLVGNRSSITIDYMNMKLRFR